MKKIQFGLYLTLIAFSQGALADTHCSNTEKVVFSCSFGKKMVSICASSDLSASAGYMQYRFGAKDIVELQYPQTQIHPRGKFDVKRQTPVLDNGTRAKLTEVSFTQGDIKYIVDSMDTGSTDKTTLDVERNGKQLASLVCNNASIVNKDFSYYEILDSFVDANNAAPVKQAVTQSSPAKQAAPQPSVAAPQIQSNLTPQQIALQMDPAKSSQCSAFFSIATAAFLKEKMYDESDMMSNGTQAAMYAFNAVVKSSQREQYMKAAQNTQQLAIGMSVGELMNGNVIPCLKIYKPLMDKMLAAGMLRK
jgi:hypothetical protein